ncbi:hypothetical protein CTI12_AA338680 [Artemisia annua]|uniref:Uncharacterized protein n=1 Tax=Artemisia annua TaxID=35608 RepID=A0A2U1MTM1_ARTAN|nr:hypothetical protein CTI12_AA338680 [Artemisia annua]
MMGVIREKIKSAFCNLYSSSLNGALPPGEARRGANPIPAHGTFSNGAQIFGNFLNCEELINQFAMKNARRTSRIIG